MKNILTLALSLFTSLPLIAQAPQAFNYQGVARSLSGAPLPNRDIGLRIAILHGAATGAEIYSETHSITTNNLGLFNIQIGKGEQVDGVFEYIDWGAGSYFIQVEMDENNGGNYQLIGSSQLLSVPYALYAEQSGNASFWKASVANNANGIYYDQGNVIIGRDQEAISPFKAVNNNPAINVTGTNAIADFERTHGNSSARFLIYGYPDSDQVAPHLRNSIMLYSTSDAKDMVLCANPAVSSIRFFAGGWTNPNHERARITSEGYMGVGTTNPRSKLQISDGDIYIENINKGVIMKSPNGNCWRMTLDNNGDWVKTQVICPN